MNLYNNSPLELEISHNNVTIVFNINTIVNKRNKEEINSEKQFIILHQYLDYKGDAFKQALMNEYIKTEEVLANTIGRPEIMPLPNNLVSGVLDLFDIDDMFDFIKNKIHFKPLDSLDETFDESVVSDGLGTRVQTYIKNDYLELVSLVQVLKTVVGPIGEFGYMNATELGKEHNHYTLFNFLTEHEIFETRPFVKLFGLVTKVTETLSRNNDESSIRVIEKNLSSDEMPAWILSIAIIQKVAMAVVQDDTDARNIITKTYNFVNNKLKIKGDTTNTIRAKRSLAEADSQVAGDIESKLESYRVSSSIESGFDLL